VGGSVSARTQKRAPIVFAGVDRENVALASPPNDPDVGLKTILETAAAGRRRARRAAGAQRNEQKAGAHRSPADVLAIYTMARGESRAGKLGGAGGGAGTGDKPPTFQVGGRAQVTQGRGETHPGPTHAVSMGGWELRKPTNPGVFKQPNACH